MQKVKDYEIPKEKSNISVQEKKKTNIFSIKYKDQRSMESYKTAEASENTIIHLLV